MTMCVHPGEAHRRWSPAAATVFDVSHPYSTVLVATVDLSRHAGLKILSVYSISRGNAEEWITQF